MTGPAAAGKDAGSLHARAPRRDTAGPVALPQAIGDRAFDGVVRPAGGGFPLEPSVRSFMEERFGHDFGEVRVHTGPQATGSAGALAAKAYTVGNDITFRDGEYAPDTTDGRRSLAHELAHVVQQRRGGAPAPAFDAGHALEHDADHAADQALTGGPVDVAGASAPGLARQEDPAEDLDTRRKRVAQSEPPGSDAFQQKVFVMQQIEKLGLTKSYDPTLYSTEELIRKYVEIVSSRPQYNRDQFDPKARKMAALEALGGICPNPATVSEQDLDILIREQTAARFAESLKPKPVAPTVNQLSREQAERIREAEIRRRAAAYHEQHQTVRDVAMADAERIQKAMDPSGMGVLKGAVTGLYIAVGMDPAEARKRAAVVESFLSVVPVYTPGSASHTGEPIETENRLPPESRPAEHSGPPEPPGTDPFPFSAPDSRAPTTAVPESPSRIAPLRPPTPVPTKPKPPAPAKTAHRPAAARASEPASSAHNTAPESRGAEEPTVRYRIATDPTPLPHDLVGDVEFAMRSEPRNTIGAGGEAAKVSTAKAQGRSPSNLNAAKRNFPLLDTADTTTFSSVKAFGVGQELSERTTQRYVREVLKLSTVPTEGIPSQVRDAAENIHRYRNYLQSRGSWPTDLPRDATVEQIITFINEKGTVTIPADHHAAVRERVTQDAAVNPEKYGLTPGPDLHLQIAQFFARFESFGLTSAELFAINQRVFAELATAPKFRVAGGPQPALPAAPQPGAGAAPKVRVSPETMAEVEARIEAEAVRRRTQVKP